MYNKTNKNITVYIDTQRFKLCLNRPARFSLAYLPKGTEFNYNETEDTLNVKNSMDLHLQGKKDNVLVYSLGNKYRFNLHEIEIPPEHLINTIFSRLKRPTLSSLINILNHANGVLSQHGKVGDIPEVAQDQINQINEIISKQPEEIQKLFRDKTSGVLPYHQITGPMGTTLRKRGTKAAKQVTHNTGIESLAMEPLNDPRVKISDALPELLAHLDQEHRDKLITALHYTSLVDPQGKKSGPLALKEMASDKMLLEQIAGRSAEQLKKMKIASKDDYTRKSKREDVLQMTWPRMLKVMKFIKQHFKGLDLWKKFLEPKYNAPTFHIYRITPGQKTKMTGVMGGKVRDIENSTPPSLSQVSPEDIERILDYSRNLADTPDGAIKGRNIQQLLGEKIAKGDDPESQEDEESDLKVKRFGSGSHSGVSPDDTILPFTLTSPDRALGHNSLLSLQRYIENTRETSNIGNAQYIIVDPTDRLKTRAIVVDADGEFLPVTDRRDVSVAKLYKKARDIDTLLATHNKKQIKEYVKDALYQAIEDPATSLEDQHIAAVALLQTYSGIRPGRNSRSNAKKIDKKWGALTLIGPHVTIDPSGKSVTFQFKGKANIPQHITINDPRAARVFGKLKEDERRRVEEHNRKAVEFSKLSDEDQAALLAVDKDTPTRQIEFHELTPGLAGKSSTYLKDRMQKMIQPILTAKGLGKLDDEVYKKVLTEPYAYRRAHFNELLQNLAAEAGRRLAHYHIQNNIENMSQEDFHRLRKKVFNLVSVFSGNRGETLDESYVIPGSFTEPFHAAYNEIRANPSLLKPKTKLTPDSIVDDQLAQEVSGSEKPIDSEDKDLSDDELDSLGSQDSKAGIYTFD